jgi:hypothetical protein
MSAFCAHGVAAGNAVLLAGGAAGDFSTITFEQCLPVAIAGRDAAGSGSALSGLRRADVGGVRRCAVDRNRTGPCGGAGVGGGLSQWCKTPPEPAPQRHRHRGRSARLHTAEAVAERRSVTALVRRAREVVGGCEFRDAAHLGYRRFGWGAECARRPARSRWCKSTTMKE